MPAAGSKAAQPPATHRFGPLIRMLQAGRGQRVFTVHKLLGKNAFHVTPGRPGSHSHASALDACGGRCTLQPHSWGAHLHVDVQERAQVGCVLCVKSVCVCIGSCVGERVLGAY
jgi:hypothetical protein